MKAVDCTRRAAVDFATTVDREVGGHSCQTAFSISLFCLLSLRLLTVSFKPKPQVYIKLMAAETAEMEIVELYQP